MLRSELIHKNTHCSSESKTTDNKGFLNHYLTSLLHAIRVHIGIVYLRILITYSYYLTSFTRQRLSLVDVRPAQSTTVQMS